MQDIIAQRMQAIQPSITLGINAKAKAMQAEGKDVITLASGEPDFAPPAHVLDAAKEAIDSGCHYYTPVDGAVDTKKAVQDFWKRKNGLDYALEQIIISTGAKQSLYNLCQVLINPDDEVIIPAPYWVSYPEIVRLADGQPVFIETTIEQNYKITPAQLEAAITPKTKLLFLNSPSNPTGMVYSAAELKELAEVLLKHPHVFIVSDDIYEPIYWADAPFSNIVMVCPKLYDRTIVVNGVSKAYAMTGWRIGYAAGPAEIIKKMKIIQSQCTSNPNAVAQKATIAALSGPQDCIATMCAAYQKRQKFMLEGINKLPGFRCNPTQGAFYLFVDVSEAIKNLQLENDIQFVEYLLDKAELAVVPGTAFGCGNHFRLSYATSDDILHAALERLQKLFT